MEQVKFETEEIEKEKREKFNVQMRVDNFNAQKGNLTEFDCPDCHNKGILYYATGEGMLDISVKPCKCLKIRESIWKAKSSGLGEYLNKNFEDYKATQPWQKIDKRACIDYAKNADKEWLLLLGQAGCGKTLLGAIVSNYLIKVKAKQLKMVIWVDFSAKIKRMVNESQTARVQEMMDELKYVEVLFIDEALKKYTEADLKYFMEIINYRYSNNLQTIITSEFTKDAFLRVDEAIASRMIERSTGKYLIEEFKDPSKNYRLRGIRNGM